MNPHGFDVLESSIHISKYLLKNNGIYIPEYDFRLHTHPCVTLRFEEEN